MNLTFLEADHILTDLRLQGAELKELYNLLRTLYDTTFWLSTRQLKITNDESIEDIKNNVKTLAQEITCIKNAIVNIKVELREVEQRTVTDPIKGNSHFDV